MAGMNDEKVNKLSFAGLLFIIASSTWSYSCIRQSVKRTIRMRMWYFRKSVEEGEPDYESEFPVRSYCRVRVGRDWKGDKIGNITIGTELMTMSCGYPFKVGNRYVVFARKKNVPNDTEEGTHEILYTGWCVSN